MEEYEYDEYDSEEDAAASTSMSMYTSAWSSFIPSNITKLATTAQSLAQNQHAAGAARTNLTNLTSRLIGTSPGNSSATQKFGKEDRPTIKSYQDEIEAFRQRVKPPPLEDEEAASGEDSDLPNPIIDPALELLEKLLKAVQNEREQSTAVENKLNAEIQTLRLSNSEKEELENLRKDVEEYEAEFRTLKNQDITIRRLEDQLEKMVETKEEEIAHAVAEMGRALQAAEAELQRKLEVAEEGLLIERSARIKIEHELKSSVSSTELAKAIEREKELERRLNEIAAELESERSKRENSEQEFQNANEALKTALASVSTADHSEFPPSENEELIRLRQDLAQAEQKSITEIAKLRERETEVELKLNEITAELETERAKRQSAEQEVKTANEALKTALTSVSTTKHSDFPPSKNEELIFLRQEIAQAEQKAITEIAKLRERETEVERKLNETTAELETERSKRQSAEQEVKTANEALNTALASVSTTKHSELPSPENEELISLRQELSQAEQKAITEIAKLRERETKFERKLNDITTELETERSKRLKAEQEVNTTKDALQSALSSAASASKQASIELSIVMERQSHMERQLNATAAELRTERSKRLHAEQEVKSAKEALQSALSSAASAKSDKEELIHLRKEVAEYELEFRGLKNQDITIRRLEEQIADMQRSKEEVISEAISKVERDLAEKASLRVADALEREAEMERKLKAAEVELRTERAGRIATQDQMMEREDGYWSQREAAWEAQRGILAAEAERLREELGIVRRERDELNLKVEVIENTTYSSNASLKSDKDSAPRSGNFSLQHRAYEAEVAELNAVNSMLREELHALEESRALEKNNYDTNLQAAELKCSKLELTTRELELKLANMPTPQALEKMQRELRVLKRLEFNAEDDGGGADPEMTTVHLDKDIENVLVDRLRKMECDLLRERNFKTELEDETSKLRQRIVDLETEKTEHDKLIESLESDLQKAIATPSTGKTGIATSRTLGPNSADPNTLQRIMDPSQIPPESTETGKSRTSLSFSHDIRENEKANDDHSVVTIIMAQRDRLRARCDALEAEKESFKQELQVQVRLSESLKTDNTKLYEKVRYLQNFKYSGSATPSIRDADLDLEALEERYEASVDPFRQFSRTERQRKLKEMTPLDRLVFMGARTLLSSKQTRLALFCYILGMHLLVFFTTHHWSHDHGCHDILSEHPAFTHLHHGVPLIEDSSNISSNSSQ